jgi:serine/threonine-protein kinase HipA
MVYSGYCTRPYYAVGSPGVAFAKAAAIAGQARRRHRNRAPEAKPDRDDDGGANRLGQIEAGRRTAPPLIELGHLLSASHAIETHTETAEDLRYLRGRGASLGGLRPKCTVADDDGRLSIGKFPSVADDHAVTKGEILALRLAAAAGIDAAEGRVVESEGRPVALIRRFDRPRGGGRLM